MLSAMRPSRIVVVGLVAITCALADAAGETWHVARTAHFAVVSNNGAKDAREAARELEQLRAVFASLLRLRVDSGKPLDVIAVKDESSMRRLLSFMEQRGKRPQAAGIFFSTPEKDWAVVRRDSKQSAHLLYHEYAHLLSQLSLGPLPAWLGEGLAEFYGGFRTARDDVYVGELNQLWVRALQQQRLFPLSELMAIERDSPDYMGNARTPIFYGESVILTHFLMLGDRGAHRDQLMELVHLREAGLSDHDAVDRVFGSMSKLQQMFDEYSRRPTYPMMATRAIVPERAVTVRELRPAEAAAFLADFLLATGQRDLARKEIDEALRLEPGLGYAHSQKGLLLFIDGHSKEATAELALGSRLAPFDPLAHYRFGAYGGGTGADANPREKALRTAIALAPSYAPAYAALAQLLLGEGRSMDEAEVLAGTAAELDPTNVVARATQLELETRLGCLDDARQLEAHLVQTARLDPVAFQVVTHRLESMGSPERAEALARRVWEEAPGNVTAVTTLGTLMERQKRPEEAAAVLQLGVALRPDAAVLLNNLAYLNAERGVQLDEALVLIDRALRITPGDSACQDTRGWVLFRLGRLKEAEEWVRKALEDGEDPIPREHLGDILEKEGRMPGAVAAWKAALDDTDSQDAEQRARLEGKIAKATAPKPPAPAPGQ